MLAQKNKLLGAAIDAFLHQPIRWLLRRDSRGDITARGIAFSFARIQGRYAIAR